MQGPAGDSAGIGVALQGLPKLQSLHLDLYPAGDSPATPHPVLADDLGDLRKLRACTWVSGCGGLTGDPAGPSDALRGLQKLQSFHLCLLVPGALAATSPATAMPSGASRAPAPAIVLIHPRRLNGDFAGHGNAPRGLQML